MRADVFLNAPLLRGYGECMAETQITYEQLFDALRRERSRDELQKLDDGFYRDARIFVAAKRDAMLADNAGGYGGLASQRASIEYQNARRNIRELYDRRERKILTLALHRARTDGAVVDTGALLAEERVFFDAVVELLVQTREQVFTAVGVDGGSSLRASREMLVVVGDVERNNKSGQSSGSSPSSEEDDADTDSASDAPQASASIPSSYEEPSSSPIGQNVERSSSLKSSDPDTDDGSTNTASVPERQLRRVTFTGSVPKVMGKDGRVYGPYSAGAVADLPDEIASVLIKKGRAQSGE